MPFGIGKKDKGGDDLDAQKKSLFGGRSKSSNKAASPAPSSANPYAAPPPQGGSSNPYANQSSNNNDPYAPKSQSNLSQPPTSSFGNLSLGPNDAGGPPPSYSGPSQHPRDKSPVPPGGYGGGLPRAPASATGGYGQAGYGSGAGYGENPYGGAPSSRGAGGYGGLGRSNSQETTGTDAGRNQLFGDAPKRAAQQQPPPPQEPSHDNSYSNSGFGGGFDSTEMPGGYGPGLSEQEQEDQDVQGTKDQIKFYNNESRDATRRMMAMAREMEETQSSTLNTLGEQGERLYNAERHIDDSTNNAATAQKNFAKLKHAQRGMFNPGYGYKGNPFTKSKNEQQYIDREVAHAARKRDVREHTQAQNYQDTKRREQDGRALGKSTAGQQPTKQSLAQRAKYEFEPDEEDDAANDEIEDNM